VIKCANPRCANDSAPIDDVCGAPLPEFPDDHCDEWNYGKPTFIMALAVVFKHTHSAGNQMLTRAENGSVSLFFEPAEPLLEFRAANFDSSSDDFLAATQELFQVPSNLKVSEGWGSVDSLQGWGKLAYLEATARAQELTVSVKFDFVAESLPNHDWHEFGPKDYAKQILQKAPLTLTCCDESVKPYDVVEVL
jgi:hypothetical protein